MGVRENESRLNLDEAVIIALGGNLAGDYGSCEALLEAALVGFAAAGLPVVRRSSWWTSTAWPDPSAPAYRNGVVFVETQMGPEEAMTALLEIELRFGRVRSAKNASRTLDLDLIAFGRRVMDSSDLVLPHPRAHERAFVMGPLAALAPEWVHPVLGLTAQQLAANAQVGSDAAPS